MRAVRFCGAKPRRNFSIAALAAKLRFEPARCQLDQVEKTHPLFGPLAILGAARRQLHSGQIRDLLDRFDEAEPFGAHQEIEHTAMSPTAEAVIEALIVADGERGCLFVVERAQAGEFAAALDQLDAPPDEIGQRHAVAQIVKNMRRKRHARPPPTGLYRSGNSSLQV